MVSTPVPDMWRVIARGEATRRLFDIVIASIALVLSSPFMLLLAVAIMCESGRPIFFSQARLGQGGRPFRMYKFRKFSKDCGDSGSPLTLENDLRLTKVGKVLLATKMDELPQFWNVLKGDMSIIGPRPESMAFADCFSGGYERILIYKPGILGPAQAIFRSECTLYPPGANPADFYRNVLFPSKARIDLEYYRNRTLVSDIVWIVRSVLAVMGVSRIKPPSPEQLKCQSETISSENQSFEVIVIKEHQKKAKA